MEKLPSKPITSIGMRFHQYLQGRGLTRKDAAKSLGQDPTFFHRLLDGADVTSSFLLLLPEAFPDLNLTWLLTGKGRMLSSHAQKAVYVASEEQAKLNDTLQALITSGPLISEEARADRLSDVVDHLQDWVQHHSRLQARLLDAQTYLIHALSTTHHE